MNNETKNIVKVIADDVLTLSHLILEDDSIAINRKINRNTLKDSQLNKKIRTQIASLDEPVVIEALFNNYINFIEWDRPKNYGKQPPIDELRDWALSRGIPTDNDTLFSISKAIQRDGHEGRPIISTLEREVVERFDKEFYKQLFDSTINELIKYFN